MPLQRGICEGCRAIGNRRVVESSTGINAAPLAAVPASATRLGLRQSAGAWETSVRERSGRPMNFLASFQKRQRTAALQNLADRAAHPFLQ
jgi:hypothetical protein